MQGPRRLPRFGVLVKQWLVIAVGVVISSLLSDGIQFESATSLIIAVVFISALNVFLKPVLLLFGLPFIVMTFGAGILLINALIFALAGSVVPGFQVLGFWPAVWGAFVVSLTTLVTNIIFALPKVNIQVQKSATSSAPKAKGGAKEYRGDMDDIIDV